MKQTGPRFRCPALAKIHLTSPSWKATTPLWVLRGDTINLAVPTIWKLLSLIQPASFISATTRDTAATRTPTPEGQPINRPFGPARKPPAAGQQSSGAHHPDDARHPRHEKPGHAIDMAKKGGSENTSKKAQGQARKADAAAQKAAAAEADKEAAEAAKWDKGSKSSAKK